MRIHEKSEVCSLEETVSHWIISKSLWPYGLWPTRLLCPWNSIGRNARRVAIPVYKGSSWPRDQTWISYTVGRFFTIWATRETQKMAVTKTCRHPDVQLPASRMVRNKIPLLQTQKLPSLRCFILAVHVDFDNILMTKQLCSASQGAICLCQNSRRHSVWNTHSVVVWGGGGEEFTSEISWWKRITRDFNMLTCTQIAKDIYLTFFSFI